MLKTKSLTFGLFAALLLVLSACDTSVEPPNESNEALNPLALDTCDEFLDADSEITINGITYRTDSQGRPSSTSTEFPLGSPNIMRPGERDRQCQRDVGNLFNSGLPNPLPNRLDGGHMIGSQLGGWGKRANLVAQNTSFNRGTWRTIEDQAAQCDLRDDQVQMNVGVEYEDDSDPVPDTMTMAFIATDPSGNTVIETATFANTDNGGPTGQEDAFRLRQFLIANGCA